MISSPAPLLLDRAKEKQQLTQELSNRVMQEVAEKLVQNVTEELTKREQREKSWGFHTPGRECYVTFLNYDHKEYNENWNWDKCCY